MEALNCIALLRMFLLDSIKNYIIVVLLVCVCV